MPVNDKAFTDMTMKPIYVAVTCDTEFLPPWYEGSWENMHDWTFVKGAPLFQKILDRYDVKGTFFAQGKALEEYPSYFKELHDNGHLIGSHGYNHEVYGGRAPKVLTKDNPILLTSLEEKMGLLEKCIGLHDDILNCHPQAFVAPFDIVDIALLQILDNLGFKTDSSLHNYSLSHNSFPFCPLYMGKIIEIPLSVIRVEGIDKNVLEAITYNPNEAENELKKYIENSFLHYPFCTLLVTCHPYEFLEVKKPHSQSQLIVGSEKQEGLMRLIEILQRYHAIFCNPLHIQTSFEGLTI